MIELIQQRLASFKGENSLQETQALKEILQELVLYALWRANFFEVAAFQGGTSLKILHKLPRFSEDLAFILKAPDGLFEWRAYLPKLVDGLQEFGLQSEVLDKERMDRNVRQAIIKDSSVSKQLNLRFPQGQATPTLRIKLEIDVNPPPESGFAYSYLDFPLDFEVCHQDLASNFALKIHALLCRPYLKGRDWYDFSWYMKQGIQPNLPHLQAALYQHGPWKDQALMVTKAWLVNALFTKIASIDWSAAAQDVERFLGSAERRSLMLWSERFFRSKIEKLAKEQVSAGGEPYSNGDFMR